MISSMVILFCMVVSGRTQSREIRASRAESPGTGTIVSSCAGVEAPSKPRKVLLIAACSALDEGVPADGRRTLCPLIEYDLPVPPVSNHSINGRSPYSR
jgi:hypothetical protein